MAVVVHLFPKFLSPQDSSHSWPPSYALTRAGEPHVLGSLECTRTWACFSESLRFLFVFVDFTFRNSQCNGDAELPGVCDSYVEPLEIVMLFSSY